MVALFQNIGGSTSEANSSGNPILHVSSPDAISCVQLNQLGVMGTCSDAV